MDIGNFKDLHNAGEGGDVPAQGRATGPEDRRRRIGRNGQRIAMEIAARGHVEVITVGDHPHAPSAARVQGQDLVA